MLTTHQNGALWKKGRSSIVRLAWPHIPHLPLSHALPLPTTPLVAAACRGKRSGNPTKALRPTRLTTTPAFAIFGFRNDGTR